MKKEPFISVIVPTFNEEKYIEPTLKALRGQDYNGKYEIIVADGMSKDNTVKIAKKYADKIVLVKKKGIAAGRNEGAKIAKGNIFLFIDADTIVLYNTISKIVKTFQKKDVVAATCAIMPLSSKNKNFTLYLIFNQFVKASLKTTKPQIAGICCAFRREAFEKVYGFDERLETAEDFDLAERISKLGKVVFVEDTLVITSPRRLDAWGATKSARRYITHYFNYLLTGNGLSMKKYRPIR